MLFVEYLQDAATKAVLARDKEDDEKLAAGIRIAVDKGVLSADVQAPSPVYVGLNGASLVEPCLCLSLGFIACGDSHLCAWKERVQVGKSVCRERRAMSEHERPQKG